MKQYLDLLSLCLNGSVRADRTGTGTSGVFGHQLRFDLGEGFPLLTTKKLHFKSIVHELLWIISGDTNIRYLQDNGVRIWDEWQDPYGSIGKGYGRQWRNWSQIEVLEPRTTTYPTTGKIDGCPNILGVARGNHSGSDTRHYNTWSEMIHRCYDSGRKHYKWYGAQGVRVCDRWLEYENFVSDLPKIENWYSKKIDPENYSLDKDYYGSKVYAPDTCIWLSKEEQRVNTSRTKLIRVTKPDGGSQLEVDIRAICRMYGLDYSSVTKVVRGERTHVKGFVFEEMCVEPGKLIRCRKFDQLRHMIQQIKNDPSSRRIVVSSWNVSELEQMRLPPCHCLFQFYVDGRKLSCQMYQRSADVFLGVPFNIASYALLTMMISQLCDLEPHEFIHTFGDVHLYKNHKSQALEQLSRDPRPLPRVVINPLIQNINDFRYEDFELTGYDPHPHIPAKVSV